MRRLKLSGMLAALVVLAAACGNDTAENPATTTRAPVVEPTTDVETTDKPVDASSFELPDPLCPSLFSDDEAIEILTPDANGFERTDDPMRKVFLEDRRECNYVLERAAEPAFSVALLTPEDARSNSAPGLGYDDADRLDISGPGDEYFAARFAGTYVRVGDWMLYTYFWGGGISEGVYDDDELSLAATVIERLGLKPIGDDVTGNGPAVIDVTVPPGGAAGDDSFCDVLSEQEVITEVLGADPADVVDGGVVISPGNLPGADVLRLESSCDWIFIGVGTVQMSVDDLGQRTLAEYADAVENPMSGPGPLPPGPGDERIAGSFGQFARLGERVLFLWISPSGASDLEITQGDYDRIESLVIDRLDL